MFMLCFRMGFISFVHSVSLGWRAVSCFLLSHTAHWALAPLFFAICNVDSQHLKQMSSFLKNMSSALPGFSHGRCNIPAEYGISCLRDTDRFSSLMPLLQVDRYLGWYLSFLYLDFSFILLLGNFFCMRHKVEAWIFFDLSFLTYKICEYWKGRKTNMIPLLVAGTPEQQLL